MMSNLLLRWLTAVQLAGSDSLREATTSSYFTV